MRCATEELAAFLIQFFGGEESESQYRWRLSLRESHARLRLGEAHRTAWMAQMTEAIGETVGGRCLGDFFSKASLYLLGLDAGWPEDEQLSDLWKKQLALEEVIDRLSRREDGEAIALAQQLADRPSVFVGILARMMDAGRKQLIDFVLASINEDPDVCRHPFNGRTLLHFAAGSGCLPVVQRLLQHGMDPNILDSGGHTALYRAASNRADASSDIIRELASTGALVNHSGGVARSTALHQAARFGNVDASKTLLDLGADSAIRDSRGFTALDRAINCRRPEVVALLEAHLNATRIPKRRT